MKEDTLMTQPSLDSLESPNHQELMQRFESSVLVFTQIYSTTIVTGYDRNHGQVRDQLYNIWHLLPCALSANDSCGLLPGKLK